MPTLTENQAYAAMFYFIEKQYELEKAAALAVLLGSMSTLPDFIRSVANRCQRPSWKTNVGSLMETCGSGAVLPGPTKND